MFRDNALLEALPVAIYTTDAAGRITFFNQAAAELWGHRPELGSLWCGSWRLYWTDGRPMQHEECPMATALREGRPVRGIEAVAERPDGTRVTFMPYPSPLRDEWGRITGGINLLVDITGRREAERDTARLAAIVSTSSDAIISKDLEGRITSWNGGATRIFGYEAEEMIGQPILRIIPPELHSEEREILHKLRQGERVDHFDTVRIAKDGRRIPISLAVSPVRDRSGKVVGASKVARDITERKRSEAVQRLLVQELNHRVKNTLAMVQAIATQSLSSEPDPAKFVANFNGRIQALARAHDLLVERRMAGAELSEIVGEQVTLSSAKDRIHCSGPRLILGPTQSVTLGLILHELATNARKYGALSIPEGMVSITWTVDMRNGRELFMEWRESGVPNLRAPSRRGFGTTLIERTLKGSGGEAAIRYGADGVLCEIRIPVPDEGDQGISAYAASSRGESATQPRSDGAQTVLRGKRILLIEDETVVALCIEEQLTSAGCHVVGTAQTIESAKPLIADTPCDAALVDVDLAGHRVDELAVALAQKRVPFIFATGHGREGLPRGFEESAVLTKPFGEDELLAALTSLLGEQHGRNSVVSLRPKKG